MTSSTGLREFDIILWGVTGFTGKLVATIFARRYGLRNSNFRVALAGRTLSRLEGVAELMLNEALQSTDPKIKEDAKHVRASSDKGESILPLIEVKDIQTEAKALCGRTHVIIALAGPFKECGEPIVKAAAECGTDYVDITGELAWVKSMRDKYDSVAKSNKARIIPCCGFDYIYNHVGVFCVQDYARTRPNCVTPVKEIVQLYTSPGSELSGGTLRTMFLMMSTLPMSKMVPDPFQLCEAEIPGEIKKKNSDVRFCEFSTIANRWMAPSIMTPMMKQYIHWTNEIQNYSYGKDFVIKIGEQTNGFWSAIKKTFGFGAEMLKIIIASKINWCAKRLAEPSGEGRPTSELETKGNFVQFQTVGVVKHNNSEPSTKVDYTITFRKGELYMMTAWGVLESAVTCLKAQRGDYPTTNQYGVGCPSQLLGHAIIDQLKLAGFNFELKETPGS